MTVAAQIAAALHVAGQARSVLGGLQPGVGFWAMPAGAPFVRLCWRNNLDRARRLRLAAERQAHAGTPHQAG